MRNFVRVQLLLLLQMLLISNCLHALDHNRFVTQYMIDVWNERNGLPQNSVFSMIQSSDGYLFMGTQEGLVRFDGNRFRIFTPSNEPGLPSSFITALFYSKSGTVWIGTERGLSRMDRGGISTVKGFGDLHITGLSEDLEGTLFITTKALKLYSLKPGHNAVLEKLEGVNRVSGEKDGTILLATNRGLFKRIGTTFKNLSPSGVDPSTLFSVTVKKISG